jgi:prepilin-type processing-associated H-X9-DG protein
VSNTKQVALGALMYAQDYDETIPRIDNNGPPYCGQTPDWGNPGTNPNEVNTMFTGVLQPYLKNKQIQTCPEAGATPWQSAIPNPAIYGQAYVPQLDANGIYLSCYSQMAVNIDLVEWNPSAQWGTSTQSYCQAGISGPIGQMASWVRPAEIVLLVGDSVWGDGTNGDPSPTLAVGNTGVWPAKDISTPCGGASIGWTWYIHRATQRSGDPDQGTTNDTHGINSGIANVAFADGHVKGVRHNALESCDYNTSAGVWAWTHWDPRY